MVHESLRERIVEHCGEDNVQSHEGSKLIVNFPFVEDELGYNLLLSFGDKCECLEPSYVREEIILKIKSLLKIYHYQIT